MAEARGGGAGLPPYATDSDIEKGSRDSRDSRGSREADASAEESNNEEDEEVFRDCTDDVVAEHQNRCLPEFQFSLVDSEYDETLAFPDSVTILSNVGDKPVLVERKETDDDEEEFDDEENNSVVLRHEIPFTSIYGPSVKFNSFQRKVFIPGREIHVRIVDTERSVTTHLLNPNL